jgi:(1->4)-alpha-D-glucan 1-alpha-D-glucosylmutase
MAIPSSTYRLQLRPGFDLHAAAQVCDYLAALGVGAVYCSPLLTASAGSDHGYDVVDHDQIDPARGGAPGWFELLGTARSAGLGVVVDIVPNHAGIADAAENAAWWDVLRLGRASPFASWFDIEWSQGRILLPVLGDDFTPGDLEVVDGELRYFDHRFPVAPTTNLGTPSRVHDQQAYELVNFRRADTDQNYRRFFAVTTLAGLRVEDESVFAETHREILRWTGRDRIDGLRVDHPDGLVDPEEYLWRLATAAPQAWITVEKILEPGESLPSSWPVAGTTGYDALTDVTNVFLDPSGGAAITDLYVELTGDTRDFPAHVEAGKRHVVTTILQAEVSRLARLVPGVEQGRAALAELLIAFPVYRSYLPLGSEYLAEAILTARKRRPDLAEAINTVATRLDDPADELAQRFQQTSGAVMAKGVEDTAYYRYTRFIALNEVGGDPAQFGKPAEDFHAAATLRQRDWPASMTTLSTHDTKRGEDVRARLFVLAEVPDEWAQLARHLAAAVAMPDPAFGYLIGQTFAGAGLIDRSRMHAYAEKAMREASDGTRWIDPNEKFEAVVHAAVDAVYDDAAVRDPLMRFLARIEPFARSNSVSQKLVALTMPGVPDVYQGTELAEDSLVDPDNRRAVDFAARRALLATVEKPDSHDGEKLAVVAAALRLRRDRPDLFGGYTPVVAKGVAAEHALAFDRGGAISVATRLPVGLAWLGGWADTTIDLPGPMRNVLDGSAYTGQVRLAELLADRPVALLVQ